MNNDKYIYKSPMRLAYQFRFKYRDYPVHVKNFPINFFGNEKKALLAARKYRNIYLKKLGLDYLIKFNVNQKRPCRKLNTCTSGIIGVRIGQRAVGDGVNIYWEAKFNKDNRSTKKSFNINLYGEKIAFTLACKERYKQAGTLFVYRGHKFPCKIPVPFEYID